MVKNIVVFGMAHSGKSTCIGYMYNRTREKDPNYNFEDYIARLKEENKFLVEARFPQKPLRFFSQRTVGSLQKPEDEVH